MYYKSNNAVLSQPTVWDMYTVKSVTTYVMNEICDKVKSSCKKKSGIKNTIIEYNSEKDEQLEKIYLMAYECINSLEKNYIVASIALNEIEKLEYNWNNNGANSFSTKLIEKCRRIMIQLAAEPFICPTACGSIQFEYEKENGDYLEFEIYEDKIEVFSDTLSSGEKEFNLQGISAIDKMKQMVVDFYA